MNKIGILGLLGVWILGFEVSNAQERGIGVSPAKIEIGESAEWPYTVPITVTNVSSDTEQFEVLVEKDAVDEDFSVAVDPGRFLLESGSSGRVLVTFEAPERQAKGLVKIVSLKTSPEGFTTGTGVKIPFRIEKAYAKSFLASVGEVFRGFGGFDQLFVAGMILATLILLWYLSGIAKTWIFNSDKR